MIDSYDIMHTTSNLDFANYTYFAVLVDGAATIKGQAFTTSGPIIVPVGISQASQVAGAGALGVLGRKKPEATKTLNSDGTWSIKG
jgi:hypothetical protein